MNIEEERERLRFQEHLVKTYNDPIHAELETQRRLVSALEQLEQAREALYRQSEEFNSAINFALSPDANLEGIVFLNMWREGDWEGLKKEFPEFEALKQQEVGNA